METSRRMPTQWGKTATLRGRMEEWFRLLAKTQITYGRTSTYCGSRPRHSSAPSLSHSSVAVSGWVDLVSLDFSMRSGLTDAQQLSRVYDTALGFFERPA